MFADFSEVHADTSCRYREEADIYPFAFRTHAHSLCWYLQILCCFQTLILFIVCVCSDV